MATRSGLKSEVQPGSFQSSSQGGVYGVLDVFQVKNGSENFDRWGVVAVRATRPGVFSLFFKKVGWERIRVDKSTQAAKLVCQTLLRSGIPYKMCVRVSRLSP